MRFLLVFFSLFTLACSSRRAVLPPLETTGSIREMRPANYATRLWLDTISKRSHLYGLGPYDRMRGELTVVDGVPLHVEAPAEGQANVGVSWDVRTPFFVSSRVAKWREVNLRGPVRSTAELQQQVERAAQRAGYSLDQPFVFRVLGPFDQLTAHVVTPRSADVAGYEEGVTSRYFTKNNLSGQLIGFYSRQHQGIFTGSSSYIHVHVVSDDLTFMGHLDKLNMPPALYTLLLPVSAAD